MGLEQERGGAGAGDDDQLLQEFVFATQRMTTMDDRMMAVLCACAPCVPCGVLVAAFVRVDSTWCSVGVGPDTGASTATPSVVATGVVASPAATHGQLGSVWLRSALYGSARLRRHPFSRGHRMRIVHEALQSTLSSKGSSDGHVSTLCTSRGASVLPDDAAVGEHDHAAASSTALLKAAVRRSYYKAGA